MKNNKRNSNNLKFVGKYRSYFYTFLFWGIAIFVMVQSVRSISITYDKLQILDEANQDVAELRLENITLLQGKLEVTTDDYIETIARDRLNYTREGEVSFVIPDDVIGNPVLDRYLERFDGYYGIEASSEIEQPTFIDSWISFIVEGV